MLQQMEKWSLNNRELHTIAQPFEDFNDTSLFKKIQQRPQFSYTEQSVTIPTVFSSFVGVKGDQDEYDAELYDLNEKLESYDKLYKKIESGLDKNVTADQDIYQKMQSAWKPYQMNPQVETARLVNSMIDSNVIPTGSDQNIKNLLIDGLTKTLEFYRQKPKQTFNELKNILFYIVHWFIQYTTEAIKNFDYTRDNPKFLYWGTIEKREEYFLLFLYNIGVDVVVISGEDNPLIDNIADGIENLKRVEFARKIDLDNFPTTRPQLLSTTIAASASAEIDDVMHSDDSSNYKPWQFADYQVRAIPLRTIFAEILLNYPEKAYYRQGWQAQGGRVTIPHLFTKVNGMHKKENEYWKFYNKLLESDHIWSMNNFSLSTSNSNDYMQNEYMKVLDENRNIDAEKLVTASFWGFKAYRKPVQKLIAEAISTICSGNMIIRSSDTPPESHKIEIFSILMKMPNRALELLQQFDYPFDVPKVVVFNSGQYDTCKKSDAVILTLLAQCGVDIVICSPSGKNDIEIFIEEHLFEVHMLEEMIHTCKKPKTRAFFGKYL